ncbi:FAD-dependent oxidoreductase [Lutimonas halocynthiae]|uniref:NAD(P)/FAD-dependent oxidoreductase n=1 Tax=Lutimonas halocynthiae TaxID=1446477 RepID=UPI0025B532CE|nr:FAD-dependent oxidoreductase [Lutimonas halocynthiae]MDN3642760.1 FAD-dependent oxidoreductase [Lutimonas halocynthiae]
MKKCIIIGGGVIGLCTAYYLQREGHQVTVIDQSSMDQGASYVNAGYISPSHIIPLSAPGVVRKGIEWMFDPSSPFYVKPRIDADFLRWAWAFNKSCSEKHVKTSMQVIRDIAVLSHELYQDISKEADFNFHFEKKGLLMLCKTEKMLEEEIEVAELAAKVDLEATVLDREGLKLLEPNLEVDAIGATFYKCDAHSTPAEFMSDLKKCLLKNGVEILKGQKVVDVDLKDNKIIAVKSDKGLISGDEFVFAAGSWTGLIAKKLGMQLLLQAGKGYRINVTRDTGIKYPAILAEAKVAVTPMNGFTRFAGTMEINKINDDVNPVRVKAIARAAADYYPEVAIKNEEMKNAASGLRPLSPDGLPYIGRTKNCTNLTIATGHAMMGWTMATGTGKLVSEVITSKKTSLVLEPFSPDRKF